MQTSIRADKTDQCRCNRTAGGTGLLSRGRLAEGERQFDVGAMKPTELKLEIEISQTNRYIYIYIYTKRGVSYRLWPDEAVMRKIQNKTSRLWLTTGNSQLWLTMKMLDL